MPFGLFGNKQFCQKLHMGYDLYKNFNYKNNGIQRF